MGIFIGGKEITSINAYGKAVTAIYAGTRLVWQAIRSCFGAGWWVNEKPWIDEEGWKN
jgi:hypothetical protein